MSATVSDLTTHLGFWMRMVSNHVSHAFALKVANEGVTVAEWCLMRALYEKEPTSPSRLAQEMGMTRGAITKLADRLIAKSMIVRAASPEDGRAQTLALTKAGAQLVPDLGALADRNDLEFFGCLTMNERQTLQQLLTRMAEHGRMTKTPTE